MENPKKPAILFLGSQMATGGGQEILLSQASWFQAQGYQVIAAFFYDREILHTQWQTRCDFPLLDLQSWEQDGGWRNLFRLARGLVRLYRLIRKERFTIVETFTHHANLLGAPVAWLAGVRVRVASHHGRVENFSPPLVYLHRQLINHGIATDLVVVSKQVQLAAIEQEGIRPERITVIANGIDTHPITPLSEAEKVSLRHSLGVEKSDPLLLTVARLKPQKGHTYLLDAIPKILEAVPKALFVFAGDGPLREELQAKALALGIEPAVRFLGVYTEISQLLQVSDVFVLPSLWEGLPVAMLEAMLAGIPIVATEVEGVEEVVQNGENGLLVPPGDPEALSRTLIQLLQDRQSSVEYNRLEQLGAAGKATIVTEYTAERMCRKYENLFNSRLAPGNRVVEHGED
jgi:glycosyltransferase involved in cell wall biosynthesis